jgi:hypothetical protein
MMHARNTMMKHLATRYIGVVLLSLSVYAEPILIAPQQTQFFAGSSLSNLRVLKQSANGTETILTLDFTYDGLRGQTARLLPIVSDRKKSQVSGWFGADPVTISSGHGTVSLKVKFFNDDPGVPAELTTDHIRVMMLTDGGNVIISEGIFSKTIKWGSANAPSAPALEPQPDALARMKAEEEQRIAQQRTRDAAAAAAVEQAHQDALAQQLAEEKAKAAAEAEAREEARLKAVAEEKARQEAETKLLAEEKAKSEAEAKAREEARLKAEAEAKLLAEEKAKSEAEAKAREEARLKAEADEKTRHEAEAKLLAEEKAKSEAEAKVREEAHLKAEADEKVRQKAELKLLADEKTKAEATAKAREDGRLKAEAEAKLLAEEKAKAEAEAKAREETAQRLAQEKTATASAPRKPVFAISSTAKTKVTNLDVVNRNLDRTEMTIAVEYRYSKTDGPVRMGVAVASTGNPAVSGYFSSAEVDIGNGSRNFVMFPVKLDTTAAQSLNRPTLPTDKVWIYIVNAAGKKSYVFQGTMMLVWHVPGGGQPASAAWAQAARNTLEIESFKQNDLFSGYVTVKYNLRSSEGHLHLSVYDSANRVTAEWFESDDIPIKSGPGLQLVRIDVPRRAHSPDVFNADTVEIQMLDGHGALLVSSRNQSPMSWAKPK